MIDFFAAIYDTLGTEPDSKLAELLDKHLEEREKHILDLRFFEGKTQMEVAEEIDISQAQVSRLEKHALKTMRNYLK